MSKVTSRRFKDLSNAIQIAAATGNLDVLLELENAVADALSSSEINLTEAAELQADITIESDAIKRGDYLDEGYAAIAQGL